MSAKSDSLPLFALTILLAACTQSPGEITRDTEPFDGIDERALISLVGNEPFWGIDIAPNGDGYSATYSTPENIEGTDFSVSRFAGNNGLGFNGVLDDSPVQVALTPGDCSDGMSDRTYPYSATVTLGDVTLYGCGFSNEHPFTGEEMP